jgi:predicted nucleic acid-binding protein
VAVLYLDSSAVVKRYVAEIGSAWVQGLTAPAAGNRSWIAAVTGVEV